MRQANGNLTDLKKKGKKWFNTSRMNVFFNHLPTTPFFFVARMLKE